MKHPLEEMDFGITGVACYRGCLVHKVHTWYEIWGKQVASPLEVDKIIELGYESIKESVERGKSITVKAGNGSFSAINDTGGTIYPKG